jgi:hypothetical protein
MFTRKTRHKSQLETETERVLTHLASQQIDSDEYPKALEYAIKLQKMKEEEKPSTLHPDTILLAATNIVGIMLIIRHEHVNVITSRAMQLVSKPR